MGVSKNNGTPKWMVKIMENPIKMDDLGVPLFLESPTYQLPAKRFINSFAIRAPLQRFTWAFGRPVGESLALSEQVASCEAEMGCLKIRILVECRVPPFLKDFQ